MKIIRGRASGAESERRSATFTGEVWADPVLPTTDGVTINNVFFTPCARTHWHRHERGQILIVTAGSGFVCTQGEKPQPLGVGDTVWVPAGEMHWHGAGPGSYLIHTAVSLGVTEWHDPVSDDDYGAAGV
ncbi:cupin domain-containing protein [Thermopolyspora sp. NPDC052614]|uniref:cupin domain-containing protein n=1 Tax=Thermopolyspora sp. NPDC052614 TaxID=3155682 RepID=UPI003433D7E9